MKVKDKSKAELNQELEKMRQQLAELQKSEAEHKRLEQSLREERDLLRTLINTLPDYIFAKDTDSRFMFNNNAHLRVLRAATQDEVLGKTDFDIFPQELAAQYYADEQATIQSDQSLIDQEEPYLDEAGHRRWLSTTKAPLKDSDGKIVGLVGMSRDITRRKQAEESLGSSVEQMKAAYEQTIIYARELKQEITERKRVEWMLEQRAAHLALINGIGRKIAAVLELDRVLDRAANLVQETFDYHHVALFLLDGYVARLKAVAGSYAEHFASGHSQKLNEGIIGWVATHGQKLVANDVSAEPRYISLIADHIETRAELCLPVKVAGQIVGILDIQSPHLDAFDENDVIAMEPLTDQIAVVIENARLYRAVRQELAERKRAEQALQRAHDELECRVEERTTELRQSEERYRDLFDNAHDLIQSLDADGRFGYVNRHWLEALGYTTAEITDLHFGALIHPDQITHWQDMFQRLQTGHSFINERLLLVTKTGQELVVEGNLNPYFEGSRFVACRGILRDITERERAERALREGEEKYRTLIEQSGDAIYLIHGGRFEVINRKFEELFGITQEMANNSDFVFSNIVTPKSRGLIRETAKKNGNGQNPHPPYEFTVLDKDGNEIEVELSVSYPAYRGGLATQGIIRDITQRKRIEEEKRIAYRQVQQYAGKLAEKIKEEQRQREIATILAEVVASVSLTLSKDELLNHILCKLQQLISYDSASIFLVQDDQLIIEAGHGFEVEIINQQHPLESDTLFQEMLTQKSYILIEDTQADPRYRPWLGAEKVRAWVGTPLVVAQEVIGYLAMDRHLPGAFTPADAELVQAFAHQVAQTIYNTRLFADLKNTQAQLIQRERLAALGQAAATMAHELRNPLMAIQMGVEYFVRDVAEDSPHRRGAALMQANVDRINRLVEDILYIARAPQPTLAFASLHSVLEDELAHWESKLTKKKISYHTQLASDLPDILMDTDQIGRAISNLISNGIDAIGTGGELRLTLHLENGAQLITLADNGPGISAEHQSKIFEPFFTTKSRGTGLGLSIVKQIIDYPQGHISLWSEAGRGTKFTITLPQTSEVSS
jgi:PAS domain S-box-containing protein